MTPTEKVALAMAWYDSGLEDRAAFQTLMESLLAQPEQEPVAWPCHIIEADFSERTITLGMECGDYKVSAGTHWLSTTPPQRQWVGLTDKDWNRSKHNYDFQKGVDWAESILKQKNGYAEEKNT